MAYNNCMVSKGDLWSFFVKTLADKCKHTICFKKTSFLILFLFWSMKQFLKVRLYLFRKDPISHYYEFFYFIKHNLFYIWTLLKISKHFDKIGEKTGLTTTSGRLLPSLPGVSWLSMGWVGGGRQVSCCRDSDVTLQSAFPIFTFTSASWQALSKCWPYLQNQRFNEEAEVQMKYSGIKVFFCEGCECTYFWLCSKTVCYLNLLVIPWNSYFVLLREPDRWTQFHYTILEYLTKLYSPFSKSTEYI